MSTTIDSRVVEMRFDNKQFEAGVNSTMSILDKFKQKLNLTGASKGIDELNRAAKNNNMHVLGSAVENVGLKFNAMYTIADQAFRNITNRAMAAGERIISALTIDPVKSGFSEYETKMGSIQTILANTQHEGTNLDDVTGALEELNTYADKTIYNFQEMTRNIGTFTAAGVDLNTSVQSIKGIANLAAVSGSTSQQASTAMYQLSQALAAGKVSLMDWNSVVNAGMGGKVFQDALIRTSELLKTGAKDAIATYGSFRESLTQGEWLTTEVLTETLKQLSGAYSEADLIAQGFTESQAKEITKLAETASDAATKVKTFTQLFDTLKETAQSGWAQTWELMFGDFEEAKVFFTGLSDSLGGLINGMSEYRNKLVGGAFNSNWDKLVSKINAAGKSTTEYEEKIRSVAEAHGMSSGEIDKLVEKHGSLAKAVKAGAFSSDILKEALKGLGINTSEADGKVSGFVEQLEKIQRTLRYGTVGDDVKSLQKALEELGHSVGEHGIDGIIGPDTTKAIKEFQEAAGITVDGIAGPETLAALKKAGTSIDELADGVKETDESYDHLIENITKKGGRELFLEGFANVIKSIVGIAKSIGAAWSNIFPPENALNGLLKAIEAFNKFSKSLLFTEEITENGEVITKFNENGEKLVKTFEGVFAILDIVGTVVAGPVKMAFKALSTILGMFDMNLLDVTAGIGEAAVALRDWIDEHNIFTKSMDKVAPFVKNAANAVRDWVDSLKGASPEEVADAIINGLKAAVKYVADIFGSLGDIIFDNAKNIGSDFVDGFKGGIWEKISFAAQVVVELGKKLLQALKDAIRSNSPSKATWEIGNDFVEGLILGIKEFAGKAWDAIKKFGEKCVSIIRDLEFGDIISALISAGLLTTVVKIGKFIGAISKPIEGFGGLLESTAEVVERSAKPIAKVIKNAAKVVKSFSKVLNGFALSLKAEALKDIAIAIAILVGSIALLTFVDQSKLLAAVGVVALLIAAMAGLFTLINYMGSKGNIKENLSGAFESLGLSSFLISFGIAILALVAVLKILETLDPKKSVQILQGLVLCLGSILAVLGMVALITKLAGDKGLKDVGKLGKVLTKTAFAILMMVGIVKLVSMMDEETLKTGGKRLLQFALVLAVIPIVARLAGGKDVGKLGKTLLKVSFALLILVGVAKLISMINEDDLKKGAKGIVSFAIVMAGLLLVNKLGKDTNKLGGTLLGMAASMLILIGVAKLISKLKPDEMWKGGIGIVVLGVIMAGLIYITKLAGPNADKLGTTLLMMSVAIGILAGIAVLLGYVPMENLIKGVAVVAVLGLIMATMIKATRWASQCVGNLVVMTVAIAVMATAVTALSMIKPDKLAGATIALGILMGMFAVIIKSASNVKSSMGTLIIMTAAIGVMAWMIYELAKLPVESTIGSAIALGGLMLAVSAALTIVSKFAGSNALNGVLALTAMAVPLFAFVGVLALMSLVQDATSNAKLLVGMATALTLLLIPLTIIGAFMATGAPLAGVVALTLMAVPLLAFVGILALMNLVPNATANATLLIGLMETLTGMLTKLAIIAPLALIGVAAMAGLVILMGVVGGFATTVAFLMEKVDGLEEFLNKGIPVLVMLADAIGTMIGKFVGGMLEGLTASLPQIGTNLSDFMDEVGGFIAGAEAVKPEMITGVKNLAAAIVLMTAADLVSGISSFLQGEGSLKQLGTELSDFMDEAGTFISGASDLNENMINGVKALAESILILTAADVLQGLASFLGGGESSLKTFGEQIPYLGEGLAGFVSKIAGLDLTGVEPAANAIKVLASVASEIPNTGGLLGDLVGNNDMGPWAEQLPKVGEGLAGFVTKITGLDLTGVEPAANAVKSLASVAKEIPNTGGLLADLIGDNDMSTWASSLPNVGEGLAGFVSNLGSSDFTNVGVAAQAIVDLAKAADKIPNTDGLWQKLVGEKSLGAFAEDLPALGENLGAFAKNIGTFDPSVISTAVTAVEDIVKIGKKVSSDDWFSGDTTVAQFGKDLSTIGSGISLFATNTAGVDPARINSVVNGAMMIGKLGSLDTTAMPFMAHNLETFSIKFKTACERFNSVKAESILAVKTRISNLMSTFKEVSGANVSGIQAFGDAINDLGKDIGAFIKSSSNFKNLGTDMITKFVDGIKAKSPSISTVTLKAITEARDKLIDKASDFKKVGTNLIEGLIVGMKSKGSGVINAMSATMLATVTKLNSYYNGFHSAGSYVASGFASGISANAFKAEAKAVAMAEAALEAAREALGIQSPSKEFYAIGDYSGQGFVGALDDYAVKAFGAGEDMANSAKSGLSHAISKIRDYINGDMDTQPVIRPVLDLSDVRAGAGGIQSIFAGGTVGLRGNINAISASMSQNGGESEVVSAINKLRKELHGNIGNTTYSVNGVTYDDGSNISNAVKDIVRAAKIGRRI